MRTAAAREEFNAALKEVATVRFFDYKDDEQIAVKPKAVELCDKRNCNAGTGCIHRTTKKGIPFCVY